MGGLDLALKIDSLVADIKAEMVSIEEEMTAVGFTLREMADMIERDEAWITFDSRPRVSEEQLAAARSELSQWAARLELS